jgi:hypothetical protein
MATTSTSKSPFSKAAIRSTYCDVFANQISRFVFLTKAQKCIKSSDHFTVCARIRPLLEEEVAQRDIYDCITTTDQSVTVHSGHLHLNNLQM